MKNLQVARGSESLDYEDLCIHPDVDIPVGYKAPKFDIFDGTGKALTWYTHQDLRNWREWQDMAEYFMNHFRFNTKITPDRFALVNLQKKLSESFQEDARRWRSEDSRAQPPLDDSELTKYFIRAQEGIYFEKMMGMMGQKFRELVKMGDF
ncbi:uncharacterized protein [Nicotiana tomentosiformis]|uniref:uncharacterized protein n=1 Tax=Nicotiana tomentosiformis TaxID=4098 RepID=UPI00051C4820|nr:uncharacterized protein LOC117279633 [Nicotiana tomentosiformis]